MSMEKTKQGYILTLKIDIYLSIGIGYPSVYMLLLLVNE